MVAHTDTIEHSPMGDSALMAAYDHLSAQINGLVAQRLLLMAEIDTRNLSLIDGHCATTTWLAHRHNLKRTTVAKDMQLARKLALMPATHMALENSEISVDHAHLMVNAHAKNPEMFERDEKLLLERTEELNFAQFQNLVRYWKNRANPQHAADAEAQAVENRELYVSRVGEQWAINGTSDLVAGTEISEGLARIEQELFENDWADAKQIYGDNTRPTHLARTNKQRRHDALVEAVRRAGSTPAGTRAPEPLINIVIDLETFTDQALKAAGIDADSNTISEQAMCELLDGTPINPTTAFELAVKHQISRIVMRGKSHVLDVGQTQRFYTGAIKRALQIRDRTCTLPACDVPSTHCEMDHIIEFAKGGHTSERNGQPLCPSDHRRKHANKFSIHRNPKTQQLQHTRPNGTPLGTPLPDPP